MKRPSFITWEQLRVGVVILVALGILTVAVFRLGAASNLFSDRYPLVTFLKNATGLQVGASVLVAGKLAGTVQEIELLPVDRDTTRNVRLVLGLDEAYQLQVRANSVARVTTIGLLGDKVIDITPGTLQFQVLAAGDTIPSVPALELDAVLRQASSAVEDVVALTDDLQAITAGLVRGEGTAGQLLTDPSLYNELVQTLDRTGNLVARLQNPNGTVGRLLEDPTLYQNLVSTTASLDSLLAAVNAGDGTLGRLLRDDTLYTRMVEVVSEADSVLTLLHTGDGLAARLLTDQQLYDRLNKTVTDLNALLEDVRRDPRRYLRGLIRVF